MKKKIISSSLLAGCFALSLTAGCNKNIHPTNEVHNPDIGGGKVLLYSTTGTYMGAANVGDLPDMVKFLPSGDRLMSANEGEPADDYSRDPKGSISIITLNKNVTGLVEDVTTLEFDTVAIDNAVRIKPGAKPEEDLEPEYIAINQDGTRAWVSLQENNALAIVDLTSNTITAVKALGAKDFDYIDIDAKDKAKLASAPDNIYGLYQPDTIVSYRVNGKDYVVSANEGDDREYDAWVDYAKAAKLKAKGKADFSTQLTNDILDVKGKKNLRILTDMGLDDNNTYNTLYLAGTRSFSIWDAEGNQVFDSGWAFENQLALDYTDTFNTRVDDTDDPEDIKELKAENIPFEMVGDTAYFWEGVDARSPKKGCEPEALAVTTIGDKTFAYIGLEKQGGFFVYDISNPKHPEIIEYNNDIDYSALPSQSGDLAPEGMVAFTQDDKQYLSVANELSGTVSLYQLAESGKATKLSSLPIGTFGQGAAEIVDYDPAGKQLFVTNSEKKMVDIISVSTPDNPKVAGHIDFSAYADNLQSVAVKNGIVAIAVSRR